MRVLANALHGCLSQVLLLHEGVVEVLYKTRLRVFVDTHEPGRVHHADRASFSSASPIPPMMSLRLPSCCRDDV